MNNCDLEASGDVTLVGNEKVFKYIFNKIIIK